MPVRSKPSAWAVAFAFLASTLVAAPALAVEPPPYIEDPVHGGSTFADETLRDWLADRISRPGARPTVGSGSWTPVSTAMDW